MRARIGDLAIVRFDANQERVGIVTGCTLARKNVPREYTFTYWLVAGERVEIFYGSLPSSRLVRARPINDDWEGTLQSLTRDSVEPV